MHRIAEWARKYPLLYIIGFLIVYFTWFLSLEKFRAPVLYVHSALDDIIPFSQYMVVPYLMWFLFIMLTFLFFLIFSRNDFMNVARYMFTGMLVCLAIYTVIPTGLTFRPEVVGTDFFSGLVRLVQSHDTPTNICPSIHVYNSIAVTVVLMHSEAIRHKKAVSIGALVLTVLICMSTVMLKQHSIIDVFWGCVLAFVLYPLSYRSVLVAAPGQADQEYVLR